MTTVDLPAAPPGPGRRPRLRARRRVPRRPALGVRPRPGRARPAPPRRRSAHGSSCSATTTSATRSSSSPTSPATPSSWPARPRPGRTRSSSSSAACTSWPSRPTSSPSPEQKVILPDLAAGCSMADMARLRQVEDAWAAMDEAGIASEVVPVTYMNSSADIKAFCGRHGGAVCTSSNAEVALEWAYQQGTEGAVPPRPAPRPQHRRAQDGAHPRRLRRLGPAPPERRAHRRAAAATRR